MQVTVSFLPVSLSLVRIPRSRLSKLSHPLLRQILKPNPSFLNITCNELELSVFAESDVLEDFEPIARRDRQKKISRSRSRARKTSATQADEYDFVEISYDTWNVLQIDSHSDGLDNSGARVHELSAPLAAAGISILYLSSYMSDFIFVKSTRLQLTVSLMAAAGFDLYSTDQTHISTPLVYPEDALDATVITRSRSHSRTESSSLTRFLLGTATADPSDESDDDIPAATRSKSHSPSASQVSVLGPVLTCVGLSDEHADLWALKIVKLVAFPELIPPSSRKNSNSSCGSAPRPSQQHSPAFEFDRPPNLNGILTPSDSSTEGDDDEAEEDAESETDLPPPHKLPPTPSRPGTRRNSDTNPRSRDPVPFYSFTRTSEGSSLTTDVSLLAALFPPEERHMVICSSELDDADRREEGQVSLSDSGTLKCLQIDLRKFGLDKHGLVNRYSQVLQEDGINHMYSSTFKTANLLVDKTHAQRAHELLRSC